MNLLPHPHLVRQRRLLTGADTRSVFISGFAWPCSHLAAARASAAVHPVPLEPNTDSKKCLECHEDTAKGKSVHSAMGKGCMSCHEVRVNKDVTRVKLITATPSGAVRHLPRRQESVGNQGDRASSRGARLPELPRSACQRKQEPVAQARIRRRKGKPLQHVPQDRIARAGEGQPPCRARCRLRHLPRHPQDRAQIRPRRTNSTWPRRAPALCLDCHDANDEKLKKAHNNQPFETANCVQCHDPHQSDSPKLMAKFQHAPFQGNGCDTCHAPAKDGKVVLTQTDAKVLCLTCHDDKAKQIETAKVQHPGAAGNCTDCHNPHASSQPGLPKTDGVNICLGCHSDIADLQKKAVHHQPAFGAELLHLSHAARRRQRSPAARQGQCTVPGVPWTRFDAAAERGRAPAHHL